MVREVVHNPCLMASRTFVCILVESHISISFTACIHVVESTLEWVICTDNIDSYLEYLLILLLRLYMISH